MDALEVETKRLALMGLLVVPNKTVLAPHKRAGRPKKYHNNSDRQRAYREKVKTKALGFEPAEVAVRKARTRYGGYAKGWKTRRFKALQKAY